MKTRPVGRPRGKADRKVDRAGYVRVRIDGRWEREHRLVMAALLGRALTRGERVAHLNGDKTDNRPDNLELRVGVLPTTPAKEVICPHCGEVWDSGADGVTDVASRLVKARLRSGSGDVIEEAPSGFAQWVPKLAGVLGLHSPARNHRGPLDGQLVLFDGSHRKVV